MNFCPAAEQCSDILWSLIPSPILNLLSYFHQDVYGCQVRQAFHTSSVVGCIAQANYVNLYGAIILFIARVASSGLGNTWRFWGWSLRREGFGVGRDFSEV
ncbi:UNVERIFIED_CONTAM: hypothetical protein K2H54_068401 [Gekko kuhli]